MVAGRIVEGSPKEIAEQITQLVGDRHVTVMLMETAGSTPPRISDEEFERLMAEMAADAVSVPHANDSREGIYTRQDGE